MVFPFYVTFHSASNDTLMYIDHLPAVAMSCREVQSSAQAAWVKYTRKLE